MVVAERKSIKKRNTISDLFIKGIFVIIASIIVVAHLLRVLRDGRARHDFPESI